MPSIQAHWALIAAANEVLLETDRVEKSLPKAPSIVPALVKAYAEGDSPWCLLDSHHRHMESRWYNFDPGQDYESLEKLIKKAEQRYTHVGSELARLFAAHAGQFYDRAAFDALAREIHALYAQESDDHAEHFRRRLDRQLRDRHHAPIVWGQPPESGSR